MENNYDIICLGAWSGWLNIAGFMNRVWFKVLLVDKTDKNIWWDCLNTGCVPSKALLHIWKHFYHGNKTKNFTNSNIGKADMKLVKEYIQWKIEHIRTHENADYFRSKWMDVVLGVAKFASKNSIIINNKEYFGKKIVIASWSSPKKLNIPWIEKVKYLTNENIFELDKLPEKLIVVWWWPIWVELSQAFARLWSEVTIVVKWDSLLPKEDPQFSNILTKQLQKENIKIIFKWKTIEFNSSNELLVEQNWEKITLEFDEILVSIGRDLNIQNLDLEKAWIETNIENTKLIVNEYLQTTNPNILLCWDVAWSYQFTHCAELHAWVIINNFFNKIFKKKVDYSNLSWITYTSPEIWTFWINEQTLKDNNITYEILETNFEDDDRSIIEENTNWMLKLFIQKNKILWWTMIGENAWEIIQELILAQTSWLIIKNIFNKIYPYPSASRINKKIISNHYSGKLTPFVKKLFKFLYKLS